MTGNTDPPRADGRWLSAEEAASALGVRRATLYAYVSRGLLTVRADPADPKRSQYPAEDINHLRAAAHPRQRAPAALEGALYEGWPLMDTALTGIAGGELVLRGRPLRDWAAHASLEATAAWLWQVPADVAFGGPAPELPALWHRTAEALQGSDAAHRSVTLWALAAPSLRGELRLRGDDLAQALGAHLRVAAACYLGRAPCAAPLHEQVAQAWQLQGPERLDAVREALVWCIDILGNVVTLSGRMLASLQGSLSASLLAAMSYGFVRLSGGEFEAVESVFDAVAATDDPAALAAGYRSRGEAVPGFHHERFPHGDPRALALLARADALGSPALGWARALQGEHDVRPTVDWGLVSLRRALGAPRDGAFVLLHLARCAGMLAHIVEQRQQGRRMWVQARYVGPAG